MTPFRRITLLAGATLLLAAPLPASQAATPKLSGGFGPGSFQIFLKKGTKKVKSLPAGAYAIAVNDTSTFHNFHLIGPAGDVFAPTSIGGTGRSTRTVTLAPGTYTYRCDVHFRPPTNMKGTFKVV